MAENYTIGTPKQDMQLNPNGTGFMSVWEYPVKVTAGAAKGTSFTVSIPAEDHNAKYIHDTIAAEVANLNDIRTK